MAAPIKLDPIRQRVEKEFLIGKMVAENLSERESQLSRQCSIAPPARNSSSQWML